MFQIYLPSDDSSSDSPAGDATTQEVSEFKAWMERFERLGLHLIADGGDLKRSYRFAADGLLKPDQCEDLLDLVEVDACCYMTLCHLQKGLVFS